MSIAIKRAYEEPGPSDGVRILVDGLWPRGLSREAARIDLWLRDIAPSAELRRWYGHRDERWAEFRERYFRELDGNEEAVGELRKAAGRGKATLVYATRHTEHSNAKALLEYLQRQPHD